MRGRPHKALPSHPEKQLVPIEIDAIKHTFLTQDATKSIRVQTTNPVQTSSKHAADMHLYELLIYAAILALLYLFVLALSPLPSLHLRSTPLLSALPWTLLPSRLLFPSVWSQIDTATNLPPTHDWLSITLLGLTLLAITAVYSWTIWRIVRYSHWHQKATTWLTIVLGGTLVFGILLLFQPALFSDDVFTYIFSGRLLTIYHTNPLNTAPLQFPADPYFQWVISGRNAPNIYGPFWLCIASLLVNVGGGPVKTLLLFKGVALLAHLLNCLLVWAILHNIAPSRRLLGTLLYAWNPLALLELAGSGHNEGILLSLLLLATLLYVRSSTRWSECGVLLLFGVAGSMNLIAFLIVPLLLWFTVRTEESVVRALSGFCWRTLVVLLPAIALYLPFWRGAATFISIISAIDMAHFVHSPASLLMLPTHWLFNFVAQVSQFPPVMQPDSAADSTLRATTIFLFVLIYVHLFSKVRHATTSIGGMRYDPYADQAMTLPGFDVLLECWSSAIFWYLILILGLFWPWYVLWALWIVVLRPLDGRTVALLLFSGTALFIYPLLDLIQSPLNQFQSLLTFGIPLVCLYIYRRRQISIIPEKPVLFDSTPIEGKE